MAIEIQINNREKNEKANYIRVYRIIFFPRDDDDNDDDGHGERWKESERLVYIVWYILDKKKK